MSWRASTLAVLLAVAAALPLSAAAQEAAAIQVQPDVYARGTVLAASTRALEGTDEVVQDLSVRLESGDEAGREISVTVGGTFASAKSGLAPGDRVVVIRSEADGEVSYYVADRYRLPATFAVAVALVAVAVLVGGRRGVRATLGLAASVAIFALVLVPQLAGGINPVLVTFLGGVAIATVTTFLTHGTGKESLLMLGSILVALAVGTAGALLATWAMRLGGFGSEAAISLSFGPLAGVDLRGLLVAGVILGCLGVLDDVAATQVSAVGEISGANPRLTARQLYRRGMRIGSQHVAALINTLFLAYAGAALPLLLVGAVSLHIPLWAFINSEAVAEEIVRTAVGSGSLILAVPLSTLLASWYFGARRGLREEEEGV